MSIAITPEPDYLTDEDRAVYLAEELAGQDYYDYCEDPLDRIEPADVEPFIRRVIEGAGWVGDGLPEIRLDVPDEDWRAGGYHRGPDGEWISFHPKILCPFTICHELAHYLRPDDGHGPQFRGANIGLVRAAFGNDAADCFANRYGEAGLDYDRGFAE